MRIGISPARVLNPGQETLSLPRTMPEACATGWGKCTWRQPLTGRSKAAQYALSIAWWDLCEIGYTLATGFLRHSRRTYFEAVSHGASWLQERAWTRLDRNGPEAGWLEDKLALADVLHLHGRYRQAGLPLCQLNGKQVVVHYHGNDDYRNNPTQHEVEEVNAGITRLVSTPDLLIHGTPRYRKLLKWLPSPLDLEELDRLPHWAPRDPDLPCTIGHTFTIASNKGTDVIEEAVNTEIRKGANLQLGLVNGVQRRESLWYISQFDVYVPTLLYGPGVASYEAMAFGVPVVLSCRSDELAAQKECIGEDLPFLYTTPAKLGKVLRDLAADPALREHWGKKGRKYVEDFHDVKKVVPQLEAIYKETPACSLKQA